MLTFLRCRWNLCTTLCTTLLVSFCGIKGDILIEDLKQTVDVSTNEDVILPCSFQSDSSSVRSIEWDKKICDGQSTIRVNTITILPPSTIFDNPNTSYVGRISHSGSSLILNSTEESDAAVYTCTVRIGGENNSSTVYLRLKKAPAAPVISGGTSSVKVGDTVQLQCASQGARPFVNHTWQSSGGSSGPMSYTAFYDNPDCDPEYGDTVSNFTWKIPTEGRQCVSCTSTGIALQGATSTTEFCFDVKGDPSIDDISNHTTVHVGDSISLFCNATGYPPPNVTWVKDGTLISSSYHLHLASVSMQDMGCYVCLATQINNTVTANGTVCVTVKDNSGNGGNGGNTGGLTTEALVGIILGSIFGCAIIAIIIVVFIKKRNHNSSLSCVTLTLNPNQAEMSKNVGDCLEVTATVGHPTPKQQVKMYWFRSDPKAMEVISDQDASGLSAKDMAAKDGVLKIRSIKKEHQGKYVCRCGKNAEDPIGEAHFTLRVFDVATDDSGQKSIHHMENRVSPCPEKGKKKKKKKTERQPQDIQKVSVHRKLPPLEV